jgi:FkbM family methyltransferase
MTSDEKLSPKSHFWTSQIGQDRWVAEIAFQHAKEGYFVDVGAHDGVWISNTIELERRYNWTGVLVEADERFEESLLKNRKAKVARICLDAEPGFVEFYRPATRDGRGGIVADDTDARPKQLAKRQEEGLMLDLVRLPAITIDELFSSYSVPAVVDYMSMDVEGAEYRIFQGFNFQKYRMKAMTIERPKPSLQELLETNGYVQVGRIKSDSLYAHRDFFDIAELTDRTTAFTTVMETQIDIRRGKR